MVEKESKQDYELHACDKKHIKCERTEAWDEMKYMFVMSFTYHNSQSFH